METFFVGGIFIFEKMFKSYYVVWKPTKRASAVPALTAFKSYYVVWKLVTDYLPEVSGPCLNRTM